jgi:carbon dioxide concentrating mechanism protein CcmM
MVRKISLAVLAAAMAGFVAACGGGGGEEAQQGGGEGGSSQEEQAQSGSGSTGGSTGGGFTSGGTTSGMQGGTTGGMQGGTTGGESGQLTLVEPGNPVVGTSYVAPLTEIFGEVLIGEHSFVASNTILRASPEVQVTIGSETNAQDNIIVRALDNPSTVGDRTSLAHHAIIRDSEVGDFVFVGFNSEVINSTLENGAFVLHGARVENVTIPENRLVGAGEEITTQEQADALPEADPSTEEFREGVLDVNAEFAEGYIELYENEGYESVVGITGPSPETEFNQSTEPQLEAPFEIQEFVRIVGDVRIGPSSQIGQRTAIRADEGSPIVIGANADIDDRVTFHALEETDIQIGDDLTSADDVVFHGPLEMGDGVSAEDRSVVFRAIVEDNVQIGEEAVIAGPAVEEGEELSFTIPAASIIPDGAIITDEESLQQAIAGNPVTGDEVAAAELAKMDPHSH